MLLISFNLSSQLPNIAMNNVTSSKGRRTTCTLVACFILNGFLEKQELHPLFSYWSKKGDKLLSSQSGIMFSLQKRWQSHYCHLSFLYWTKVRGNYCPPDTARIKWTINIFRGKFILFKNFDIRRFIYGLDLSKLLFPLLL